MVSLNKRFSSKPGQAKAAAKPAAKIVPFGDQCVELEISLRYIKPRIWRRFVVPEAIKLHRLHAVIQTVMGWTDTHLHSFRVGDREYVHRDAEDTEWDHTLADITIHDEREHTLRDLVRARGDKFTYTYDFGDSWDHDLKVKSITLSPKPMVSAVCVAGARACPPENCGGPYGYLELCEALPDPRHPQHEHWKDWIEDYDPQAFDLDEINQALSRVSLA